MRERKKLQISILFFMIFTAVSYSQWSSPTYLTTSSANYTGFTTNSARTFVTSGSDIYVVWSDSRWWTSGDIYFRHSTNGGASWEPEVVLTNNQPDSKNAAIAVLGTTIHIVWEEYGDGNAEIYYKRSTDNGATWGASIRLTNNTAASVYPAITVSANGVHVSWRDSRDGNTEIYYKRSTNEGLTWGADTRLTNNSSGTGYPSIVSNGTGIHIAWMDNRDGNNEIYYKRSTDNGSTWSADLRLTNNASVTQDPCLATSGLNLFLAFSDNRSGHYHIYYKKSADLGGTWSADQQVTSTYWNNYAPSIAIGNNSNNIHIAYTNSFTGSTLYDAFYIRSTNGGSNWGTEDRITQTSYGTQAQIGLTGNTVHILNRWAVSNFFHIEYWRNTTGNPTAISPVNTEVPSDYSLGQNYPNPFNPSTNISFSVPARSKVRMIVFDLLGKQVSELVNEEMNAGNYKVDFNAAGLASGTYFYSLEAGEFRSVKKMILVK